MLIVLCCVVCAFAWVAEVRDPSLGKLSVWAMGYFGYVVLCWLCFDVLVVF